MAKCANVRKPRRKFRLEHGYLPKGRRFDRNGKCPCGSGKKYKACCLPATLAEERRPLDLKPPEDRASTTEGEDQCKIITKSADGESTSTSANP